MLPGRARFDIEMLEKPKQKFTFSLFSLIFKGFAYSKRIDAYSFFFRAYRLRIGLPAKQVYD